MEPVKSCSTASASQQESLDRDAEARIFSICAKAGVSCIGIQRGFGIAPDFVLFQPVVTTLAIPLATFANPELNRILLAVQSDSATACRSRGSSHCSGNGRRASAYSVWMLTSRVGN